MGPGLWGDTTPATTQARWVMLHIDGPVAHAWCCGKYACVSGGRPLCVIDCESCLVSVVGRGRRVHVGPSCVHSEPLGWPRVTVAGLALWPRLACCSVSG
jgi:hypothetical protein